MLVDAWFAVRGRFVPRMHGYLLYAALSRVQPVLHEAPWLGVHTLSGVPEGDLVLLTPGARLGLRLPSDRLVDVLPLVGSTLGLDGHQIHLGPPEVQPLRGAPCLSARMVTIKGQEEPATFREAIRRQLDHLGVKGEPLVGQRRVDHVINRQIVGFSTHVRGLGSADALRLLAEGLGGRRRMGCGLFLPTEGYSEYR